MLDSPAGIGWEVKRKNKGNRNVSAHDVGWNCTVLRT